MLLPIAPFTETAGTFVNAEGRVQSFHGVVKPLGEARPAWKVLRVLGNLLGLPGFDHDSAEAVRDEALGGHRRWLTRLSQRARPRRRALPAACAASSAWPTCRSTAPTRWCAAPTSLQLTRDAQAPVVGLPSALWQQLGLQAGDQVRVSQDGASCGVARARGSDAGGHRGARGGRACRAPRRWARCSARSASLRA